MLACHARVAIAGLLLSAGCTTAEDEFNAFRERYEPLYPPIVVEGCSGDPCTPPTPPEADGQYLFTLSAALGPTTPVLLDAQVTYDAAGLSMTTQALRADDRTTKIGDVVMLGPFTVAPDGCFQADFPPLNVPGEANPITGNPITADVTLIGRLCSMTTPPGFFCGDITGAVTAPANIDLGGSTFTFEKTAMPDMYPNPPKINCNQDPADPPM